jgi:hypothetical protein
MLKQQLLVLQLWIRRINRPAHEVNGFASGGGRAANMDGAWAMDRHQNTFAGAVDAAYESPVAQASHVPGPGFPFELLLVGSFIINFQG